MSPVGHLLLFRLSWLGSWTLCFCLNRCLASQPPFATTGHHHPQNTRHLRRSIKKGVFLVLRQALYTVQATVFVGGNVGRPMVQYAEDVSKESVIDVRGTLVVTPSPVSGCTQKEVELKIEEVKEGLFVFPAFLSGFPLPPRRSTQWSASIPTLLVVGGRLRT